MPSSGVRPGGRALAWAVHLFTAGGAVAGLLAITRIHAGDFRAAFFYMAAAVVIDGLDGFFARAVRVKERLPNFDGALLDNIVDYFNYVAVPAVFICESGLLTQPWSGVAASAMLLSSAYQFCRKDAKTEDHFFLGFPSYWNIVTLYLFLLGPAPPLLNLAILLGLSVMAFVPIPYVYPSRTAFARQLTLTLTGLWAIVLLFALARYPEGHRTPAWLSLGYVGYYLMLSASLAWTKRQARKRP